jgi:hypothetical protein
VGSGRVKRIVGGVGCEGVARGKSRSSIVKVEGGWEEIMSNGSRGIYVFGLDANQSFKSPEYVSRCSSDGC